MPNKIKLESVVPIGFDRQTGKPILKVAEEYVCEICRHLVEIKDKFCWHCGAMLEQSDLVEHYQGGEKLSNEEYRRRKPK